MDKFIYKFNESSEIFTNIKNISDFSVLDFIILFILMVLVFVINIYILPNIYKSYLQKRNIKERKKKMNLIKQIAMQKDIEEEVEKEIELDTKEMNLRNAWKEDK